MKKEIKVGDIVRAVGGFTPSPSCPKSEFIKEDLSNACTLTRNAQLRVVDVTGDLLEVELVSHDNPIVEAMALAVGTGGLRGRIGIISTRQVVARKKNA